MTTMNDKIRLIQNLKKQVKQLKIGNFSELDAIQRNMVLLINRFFGESCEYKTDLKEIDFPEVDPSDPDFPVNEETWFYGKEKMINLLNTMIKDLKLSGQIKTAKVTKPKSNSVFIVHGTDHKPMEELKTILSGLGLNPIVLHEQPSRGKTVVEKLESYSDVGYAFVLLTADDGLFNIQEAKKLLHEFDSKQIRNYQKDKLLMDSFVKMLRKVARQNVILELGYFMGLLGRNKVCCLYNGNIVLPSDIHGIVYVPFKNSVEEAKYMIVKELRAAGYQVEAEKHKMK